MSGRYALPVMTACTSCGQCCGPAMASRDEIKRIRRLLKDTGETWIPPGDDDPLRCGFLRRDGDATRCAVYEARPWVCRAFGVVKQIPCGFFPDSAIVDMPADEAVGSGRMPATSKLLGEVFEPGYDERLSRVAEGRPEMSESAPVCDACLTLEAWKRIALRGGSLAWLRCPPHRDDCPYKPQRGRRRKLTT